MSLETHRGGGACAKLARKRRTRRTGDPENAPSWTPSLQFAPRESGQGANWRRCKVDRASICATAKWTAPQFASRRRRHRAACRRQTRRLLSDSQNGRRDLNRCPQNRCALRPATARPTAGERRKKRGTRASGGVQVFVAAALTGSAAEAAPAAPVAGDTPGQWLAREDMSGWPTTRGEDMPGRRPARRA